ncbi:hypothetical protein [Streptantibioticus cattleyicolor]|uniref:hypothetical protein n=1 Tax=Streptantibioticus cattleyicolor TaxID=29303 RepID=UPI000AE8E736|nr:hypothetical protein [Streptantibioticus cattleyicolor]
MQFLHAAESAILTLRAGEGEGNDRLALQRAFSAVLLEGPSEVARAARKMVDALRADLSWDDLESARAGFVEAARVALQKAGES